MPKIVSLAQAVERLHAQEGGASKSTYARYRESAHAAGHLWVAGLKVPAMKVGNRWMVEAEALERAIEKGLRDRTEQERAVRQADDDYAARRLAPSGSVQTSWGCYSVSGAFHFVWSDYQRERQKSEGGWRCNGCWSPAAAEHNAPECHRCSDWGSCGADCTLSRVFCASCGTSLLIRSAVHQTEPPASSSG